MSTHSAAALYLHRLESQVRDATEATASDLLLNGGAFITISLSRIRLAPETVAAEAVLRMALTTFCTSLCDRLAPQILDAQRHQLIGAIRIFAALLEHAETPVRPRPVEAPRHDA